MYKENIQIAISILLLMMLIGFAATGLDLFLWKKRQNKLYIEECKECLAVKQKEYSKMLEDHLKQEGFKETK